MKLALAGDTMLGRKVAERLGEVAPSELFAAGVVDVAREADLFVVNLECTISDRGERWPDPGKPFFFRAPPVAADVLRHLGVGCVTLANNHALDYGVDALLDTFGHLADAGIAWVGAGADEQAARAPAVIDCGDCRVGVVGVTDHPSDYAVAADRPGVAYADLRHGPARWLLDTIAAAGTDVVVVSPHWGPNMAAEPAAYIRHAAAAFLSAGATLVAGHSAHVFHGVGGRVLYDLGDFIDDYATDPNLRNDLGLLFLVTFEHAAPVRVEAVPIALDYCRTRLARPHEAAWIGRRFRTACAAFGTNVFERDGRLVIDLRPTGGHAPVPRYRRRGWRLKGAPMDNEGDRLAHEGAGEVDDEEDQTRPEPGGERELEGGSAERAGDEEEEPERGEPRTDVEVGLDVLLRERLEARETGEEATATETTGEDQGPRTAPLRVGGEENVRPRREDEFVCQGCFLVKRRNQLADPARSLCIDCASSEGEP